MVQQRGTNWYKSKTFIVLSILLIVVIIGAVYLTFMKPKTCGTFQCFQEGMYNCERVSYVNDEPLATWRYVVRGESSGFCRVVVTMLQAKAGDLHLDSMNGQSMQCSFETGTTGYPEKDIDKCTGPLKEGMQGIIIDKLHKYILSNLGQLDEELNKAV